MSHRYSSDKLKNIIDELMESTMRSKDKAGKFYQSMLKKSEQLEDELINIQCLTKKSIDELKLVEIQFRLERKNLIEITNKVKSNTNDKLNNSLQKKYELAYTKADNLRLKQIFLEEEMQRLFSKREEIAREIQVTKGMVTDAEDLMGLISTSFTFLSNDLTSVGNELDEKEKAILQIIETGESEKKRISREIHDGPTQSLVHLLLELQILKSQAKSENFDIVAEQIAGMEKNTKGILKEMREVIYDLSPMSLDDIGLIPTVENFINSDIFANKFHIRFKYLDKYKLINHIPSTLNLVLFRLIQESLNNAYKHSKATLVSISLTINEKTIELDIRDNGVGFDVDKAMEKVKTKKSFGLLSMTQRVDSLSGTILFNSEPNKGSNILISVPTIGTTQI